MGRLERWLCLWAKRLLAWALGDGPRLEGGAAGCWEAGPAGLSLYLKKTQRREERKRRGVRAKVAQRSIFLGQHKKSTVRKKGVNGEIIETYLNFNSNSLN